MTENTTTETAWNQFGRSIRLNDTRAVIQAMMATTGEPQDFGRVPDADTAWQHDRPNHATDAGDRSLGLAGHQSAWERMVRQTADGQSSDDPTVGVAATWSVMCGFEYAWEYGWR